MPEGTPRFSLWGGISNINSLLQGTPEDVKRDAYYAMEAGFEVIGIECSVPVQAPDRNLMAIMEAVKEYPVSRSPRDQIREFAKGLARSFMDEDRDFFKELVSGVSLCLRGESFSVALGLAFTFRLLGFFP